MSGHRPLHPFDDVVGLHRPTVLGPFDRTRRIGWIPCRRAGISPRCEQIDFAFGERRIVGKRAARTVGEPGRHLPCLNLRLDALRPRPRAVERQHRKRRDLAWAMAALAVLLKDWQDVLVERRRVCLCSEMTRLQCGESKGSGDGKRHVRPHTDSSVKCQILH